MLKGFHLAPSLKIITNTQAKINRKEKNFIRQNQVQPNSGLWLPDYMVLYCNLFLLYGMFPAKLKYRQKLRIFVKFETRNLQIVVHVCITCLVCS